MIRLIAAAAQIETSFDGWGREAAQSRACAVLREAGLAGALPGEVVVRPDPHLPAPTPFRAASSGLINEEALLAMIEHVHDRVVTALTEDRLPLVYGGDCTVLLGAVPALRDVVGRAGLVFVDGHEDTTSLDSSPDGEAANMEVGLPLGLTGQLAPARMRRLPPALASDALSMLGMRDQRLRRELNVASLAERGVLVRDAESVAADARAAGESAATHASANSDGWWLHLDVDVLARDELASQRVRGDQDTSGGLSWTKLTDALREALSVRRCHGISISIYDPDQDPTRPTRAAS